jgi:hypothetical protein
LVHICRRRDGVALRWHYDWRILLEERVEPETALSSADWNRLRASLITSDFWNPQEVHPFGMGLDGATWLFEGRRGNIYHAVERWSPEGSLRALGQLFFSLAGPPLSDVRLY